MQFASLPRQRAACSSAARMNLHLSRFGFVNCKVPNRAKNSVKLRSSRQAATEAPDVKLDLNSKIAFLREDLQHLFDEKGIDAGAYEDVVDFKDPITKYTNLSGYLFNIAFLKKAFNPKFELHEIWASDPTAVTTRWTMTMEFTATKGLPLIGNIFKPTIVFTGTSTYVFNPASGKIFRHIDIWDSISNQEFFSIEGFLDFLKQLLQPYTTPSLETPEYTLLKRTKDYQIRRYKSFMVAECPMDDAAAGSGSGSGQSGNGSGISSPMQLNPAGPGMRAFQELAGYIFGKNQRGEVMKMTTPVYSDTSGKMQFVIGTSAHKEPSTLPPPASPLVSTKVVPGGLFAARIFNGVATPNNAEQQQQLLRASITRDGLKTSSGSGSSNGGGDGTGTSEGGWTLARYNDPGTPAILRRNEVLIPLDEEAFSKSWP